MILYSSAWARSAFSNPQAAYFPYNSGLPAARQAAPFQMDLWKQWEGQSVATGFVLERCVGGSSCGAVFTVQFEGRPAAVKLLPGTRVSNAALIAAWEKAARLSHPALLQTLAYGETDLGDANSGEAPCAYIVMERAEENLAEVVAERSLTSAEARAMLVPVIGVLQYLDEQGFSHGRLKPANILACGDQVKISSDGLAAKDSATDCQALGALLQNVLQDVLGGDANLPSPFAEIVKGCLAPAATERWDLARIEARLREKTKTVPVKPLVPVKQPPTRSSASQSRAIGWGLAGIAVAGLAMYALWPAPMQRAIVSQGPGATAVVPEVAIQDQAKPSARVPEAEPAKAAKPPQTDAKRQKKEEPKENAAKENTLTPEALTVAAGADGITRVLPDIGRQALGTINGKVRINVRVHVDNAGNVSQATLQFPSASKYFIDRVLPAAQSSKFPGGSEGDWVLHYELLRTQMRVSSEKLN